jgi:hypothetical protein
MDVILALMGVAILTFTVTMIILFCVFQSVPDELVRCFFACCGSEGGFMAVIMVAKKLKGDRDVTDINVGEIDGEEN